MKLFLSVYILLFIGCCNTSSAVQCFILTDSLKEAGITRQYLEIFEDKNLKWNIDDVSSESWEDSFHIAARELPRNKPTGSAFWLKLRVCNNSSPDKKWLIEFFDHNINQIQFYKKDHTGKFRLHSAGNSFRFSERWFLHKNIEFDLTVPVGAGEEIFIRIYSDNENVIVPQVRSLTLFVSYALQEYYLLGMFYGILGIMAVYNMLLFVLVGKRYYLFYTFYVISVFLFTMSQNGLAFAYIWPDTPGFNYYSRDLFFFLSAVFLSLFARDFLEMSHKVKNLNITLIVVLVLRFGWMLFSWHFYPSAFKFGFLDLVPLTITYLAMWSCYRNKQLTIKNFILAYTLVYFTYLVTILEEYGWITSGILTVYSFNIGVVVEIVLLSLSLAQPLRKEIKGREEAQTKLLQEVIEKEKITTRVNLELEEKVKLRTAELGELNIKLEKQVAHTNMINQKLDLLNWKLKQHVSDISQKRIIKPVAEFPEFLEVYPDELACFRYLHELKSKKIFTCKNCDSATFGKGKEIFDRRCTKCGYNESVTANTLFQKLKFPIVKAFYITHLVYVRQDITAEELSGYVSLRKETCSVFKRKILERIETMQVKDTDSWEVILLNAGQEFSDVKSHTESVSYPAS